MIFLPPLIFSIFIFFVETAGLAASNESSHYAKKSIDNQVVFELDDDVQEISGVQTLVVKLTEFSPEVTTFGKAISVKPLFDFRRQYLIAASQHNNAKIKYGMAQKSLFRLQNLHRNEAISTRKLQEQQSQWQSDKSDLNAAALHSQMLLTDSRLQWGKVLTRWFSQVISKEVDNISANQSQLLQIMLPPGEQLPEGITTIQVAPDGNRKNAVSAAYVSASPLAEPISQRAAYFFLSSSPAIQTGMQITAWIPAQAKVQRGIMIPSSAMLWHLAQAFVFVKSSDDIFTHRNIDHYQETPDGYFITSGLEEGEEVVTRGAQMLLSHEFRSQIPDEDDDD